MKTNTTVAVLLGIVITTFTGCSNPSSGDDPPPVPVPVKMYIGGGMSFTNMANTADTFSNTATTGIYQMDNNADGVVDDATYRYNGNTVAYTASTTDVFSITAGATYINNTWLCGATVASPDVHLSTAPPTSMSFGFNDGSQNIYFWLATEGNTIVWLMKAGISNPFYPSSSTVATIEYNGSSKIKITQNDTTTNLATWNF